MPTALAPSVACHGKSFQVDTSRHAAFWAHVDRGEWEPATFEIFDRFIDPERAYLDIGAWIGPTVLYGCQLASSVYAVEPDPLAAAELTRNLELNRPLTDEVRVFQLCIAPETGDAAFGSEADGGDSRSSLLFRNGKTQWTVATQTFEDFVATAGITDCAFIKMDIEGGEYSVLPTMEAWLRRYRPTLYLSLHPAFLTPDLPGLPGKVLRGLVSLVTTAKILHRLRFYRHIYDEQGRKLNPINLLRHARGFLSIVATDRDWC